MYREVTVQRIKIPDGFATAADAYWHVLESADILDQLKDAMAGVDKADVVDLTRRAKRARDLIFNEAI
jgi:pyruvate,water dikinase